MVEANIEKHLTNVLTGSLAKPVKSSVQKLLDERMTITDAIIAVRKMLVGFPNQEKATDGYIGAMAEVLCYYPKSIAVASAHPIHGACADLKFLPTRADLIQWCERKVGRLHEECARELRIEKQLAERNDYVNQRQEGYRPSYEDLKMKYGDGKGGWIGEGGSAKRIYSEAEKRAFLEDAKKAGQELCKLKLSPEAQALLQEQDQVRGSL
jgi:hypothetical protein